MNPEIDQLSRPDAEEFLAALAGTGPVTFQTFDDDQTTEKKRGALACVLHGTLAQHWPALEKLNAAGAGIYVMVNEGDGIARGRATCRTKENVTGLRALFLDDDTGAVNVDALRPAPSLVVQSKAGVHVYWTLRAGEPLDAFTAAQERLAKGYGTDAAIKDLPRVMRVPGFLHRKDPAAPALVRLIEASGARYSIAEVLEGAPKPPEPAKQAPKRHRVLQGGPERARIFERARLYLEKIPGAVAGEHGHDRTWDAAVKIVRGFDLSEDEAFELLLTNYNPRCSPEWSERELRHKVADAAKSNLPAGFLLDRDRPTQRDGASPPPPSPRSREPGSDDDDEEPSVFPSDGNTARNPAPNAGPAAEPKPGDPIPITRISDRRAQLAAVASRYVFVREQNAYFEEPTGAVLSRESLNSSHAADRAAGLFYDETQRKTPKASEMVDRLSRQVENLGWWPGKPFIYTHESKRLVNTFRPPIAPPRDRPNPRPWLDHLEWLIPIEAEREHVLDMLAFNVQRLDGKVNHALVLGGTLGIGKDLLLQPLQKWLRTAYVNVKYEELDGAFTHYLKGAKILVVQEAKDLEFKDGFGHYNFFKTIIAAPPEEISINEKFLRPYSIPNLVQVVFFTNFENGVYFEEKNDRRYFVVWSPVQPREQDYYAQLGAYVEEHFLDVVGFLGRRSIAHFNPKAHPPATEAREAMHTATRSAGELVLRDLVEQLADENSQFFSSEELRTAAQREQHKKLMELIDNGGVRLGKLLKSFGMDTTKAGKKRVSIYWRRGRMTEEEAKDAYSARARRQSFGGET